MGEFYHNSDSLNITRELPDSILSFLDTNQQVSETALKDMLVSFRGTIDADIMQLTKHFTGEIHGSRVDHIENKIDVFAHIINYLVDAHDENIDEHYWIKAKLADLEDHARRNNKKIEESQNLYSNRIFTNVNEIFKTLIPELTDSDPIIDRIHRISILSFIPVQRCVGAHSFLTHKSTPARLSPECAFIISSHLSF